MAKQTGAIRFIGKVGNVVGFKNAASSKAGSQFVREHAASVSNPKSYNQAKQRAKVRPAQLFYQAFENVLNHAFLPSQRASKNRNRFLSLAMSNTYIPDVYKGENRLPRTALYQVSEGALGLDAYTIGAMGSVFDNVVFNLAVSEMPDFKAGTVAEFSNMLISLNPLLQEGDELAFIAVLVSDDGVGNTVIPVRASVVLNQQNTVTKLGDLFESLIGVVDNGKLAISADINDYLLASAALIISRRTSSSWIYTNSTMALSAVGDNFTGDEELVIESYMNASSAKTSDKYLQQADGSVIAGIRVNSIIASERVLPSAEYESAIIAPATNAALAVLSNGERAYVVTAAGQMLTSDGQLMTITKAAEGSTAEPMTLDKTAEAGNPTILLSEVQRYGFFVTGA